MKGYTLNSKYYTFDCTAVQESKKIKYIHLIIIKFLLLFLIKILIFYMYPVLVHECKDQEEKTTNMEIIVMMFYLSLFDIKVDSITTH